MSEWQFMIVLLLQGAMAIGVTLYLKYLIAYSSKKGENRANIEDNQKIISGIESIKLEFTKLQESDRIQKNLILQRLISHNSLKDNFIFQIYEESDQLFYEFSNIPPNCVGYDMNSQIARADYFKCINKLMRSIITKKSKLSFFFSNNDEIPKYAEQLIIPLIKADTALLKISEKIDKMHSSLLAEKVYYYIHNKIVVNDKTKMAVAINHLYKMFYEQMEFVYSLQIEFTNNKQLYLAKVQEYYEQIRCQINAK